MIEQLLDPIFELAFLWLKRWKGRNEEWRGVLIRKIELKHHSLSSLDHRLVFRRDDGRIVKIRVDKAAAWRYTIGCAYFKKRGDLLPDPATEMAVPETAFSR